MNFFNANVNKSNDKNCIVIVDDEKDLLFLYKKVLYDAGFLVSAFNDPLNALKEFKDNYAKYDLILTDLRMPGMNGYELINKIKNINPLVKVILVSAYNISEEDISQHLNKEIKLDKVIRKPVTMEQLMNTVRSVLLSWYLINNYKKLKISFYL